MTNGQPRTPGSSFSLVMGLVYSNRFAVSCGCRANISVLNWVCASSLIGFSCSVVIFTVSRLRRHFILQISKIQDKGKRLPSVGYRSWSRFLAVSLQVAWVINPAVGCHYFPPGLQLPPQLLRGLLPILLLVNRGTTGVNSLPKTVTRQRRDCDLNPGFLRLSPTR